MFLNVLYLVYLRHISLYSTLLFLYLYSFQTYSKMFIILSSQKSDVACFNLRLSICLDPAFVTFCVCIFPFFFFIFYFFCGNTRFGGDKFHCSCYYL